MSTITPGHNQPSDPNQRPSERSRERAHIPSWWSLVLLIMAGLVYLPIQYANMHSTKPEEQQAAVPKADEQTPAKIEEASPKRDEKAEPAKEAAAEPTHLKQEEAPAPAKQVAAEAVHPKEVEPAKEAAHLKKEEKAEPVKQASAEATQPKAEGKAEPAKEAAAEPAHLKEEKAEPVKQASAEATQPKADGKAEPAKEANAEAAHLKKEEKAEPVKQAAANAPEATQKASKPAAEAQTAPNQKVALAKEPVAAKTKIDNAVFYHIEGRDKQGRAAAFDFITFTGDYKWANASSSQVVAGGKVIPEDKTVDRLLPEKVRASLGGFSNLVAVGLASQDGRRAAEEARAVARSKTAAGWLKEVAKPETAIWTLSLGQYDGAACKKREDADANFDRPVIFAGVRSKEDGVNLQEALADAIDGHDNLPSRDCYSRFDLAQVR